MLSSYNALKVQWFRGQRDMAYAERGSKQEAETLLSIHAAADGMRAMLTTGMVVSHETLGKGTVFLTDNGRVLLDTDGYSWAVDPAMLSPE